MHTWTALARAELLVSYRGHGLSVRVFAIDGMLFYKSTGTSSNSIKLPNVYLPFFGYYSSETKESFPHQPRLHDSIYEAHLVKWSEILDSVKISVDDEISENSTNVFLNIS